MFKRKPFILILLLIISISMPNYNFVFGQENTKSGKFEITGGILGTDYTYETGILKIKTATPVTVSGTTSDRIVVEKNVNANITFNGLKIESNNIRPFDMDGATVTLNLKGENSLKSSDYKAALFCPAGSELTIEGDGILTATVGNRGGAAAIGAESGESLYPNSPQFRDWRADSATCGKITINGGTVNANCPVEAINGNADTGLAIGGQKGGPITINGGKVTAIGGQNTVGIGFFSDETDGIFITGGEVTAKVLNGDPLNDMGANTSFGPPIGFQSGSNNSKAKITINGGIVNAVSGHYGSSGIGGARGSSGGIITITGDANVTAKGGYGAAGIGAGYAQNSGGNSCAITIDGNAIVNTTGGINAPGIGSGAPRNINAGPTGNAGVITIAGNANVTAVGGQNATGIGTGASTASGLNFPQSCIAQKIVITENAKVNAKVGPSTLPSVNPSQSERFEEYICTVSGIEAIEAKNSLTVDENGNYILKGNVTLTRNLTVPDGKIIVVPKDAVLNVPKDITFTYPSNSNVEGQIVGDGNIIQTDATLIPSIVTLSTDKERYIYGDIVILTATVSQKSSSKIKASNEIAFYNGDTLLETKQLVDNSATIEIDTKTTGAGTLNLKAKFSGNDILGSSETVKSIVVNKANFDTPSGYDDNDYQKLVEFLESPSANSSGTKNGQELNPDYSPADPDTWTGITWTEGSDIKKVEKIVISFKSNISGNLDLSGFSSLTYLHCSYTKISDLNLNGISSLKTLYCYNTLISSLNLNELSNLEILNCYNTLVSSLDLTGLSNLKTLDCYKNRNLTSLNLTGLSSLQNLTCYETQISSLDLANLPNLEKLSCSNTQISNLNLNALSKLNTLVCSDTQIKSLDLTGLSNLVYLACFNSSISNLNLTDSLRLRELYCYNTDLSNLNLTGLSNLTKLNCSDTQITELDLNKIPNLQELNCSNIQITKLDLNKIPNLQKLSCSNTQINSLDLTGLSKLTALYCNNTLIDSLDLTGLSKLETLHCYNSINLHSLTLADNSSLKYLSCYNTLINSLDLTGLSNLQTLDCYNCKLGINELKKLKLDYPNLFKNSFLNQDILGSYLFVKGDIKEFGSETSTYTWYIGSKLMDLKTSAYDFSAYNDSQVRCEITDGNITLVSNTATIKDTVDVKVKFQNPPQGVAKGSQVKLLVKLEPDINIDKSVSWEIYNSTASTISHDGILNVPLEEASTVISVRATSNFDNTKYAEINLNILSPSQIDLQTDKERYIYGDTIKLTATVSENQNARANNSNKIAFYNGDNLLETKQLVDNSATIEIDTKTTGAGTLNLKAKFSGNDVLGSSEAVKRIVVNKANFDTPSGYDDNDYQKLVEFLESPSANSSGTKNGQELNPDYSPTDPDTWTGITWTKDLDIKKVEKIYTSFKHNISGNLDLTGFSNLKYLSCDNTKLSSLDVTGLFNLKDLYCGYTKISSLDVTGLSNLKSLDCSYTDISSLDVTGLANLQTLSFNNTSISSLDVTGLANLQTLFCNNTSISSLDLTGLANLQTLSCISTSISSLDLTGLSNLKTLSCGNTDISSLDLTGPSNLEYLSCNSSKISSLDLTGLSNLKRLDCSYTDISSLDLTGLSNLEYLSCNSSKISSLDLTGLSNLKTLECNNTSISSLDVTGLSNLQGLYCSNTDISSLDVTGLSSLQSLNCSYTDISSLDLTGLANLKILDCNNCKLGINELKKLKLDYPNLFKNRLLKQDIFGSYLFAKGDIKEFGSETSTYKWYISSSNVINLPTSAYDFSAYNNRPVRCEITDGDITLISNTATIKDTVDVKVKFQNPPQGIAKGSQIKLLVKLEPDINIDKSVSWEVYNSTASTISQDGILNVPLEEASKVITVRATSNFDNTKYAEINLNILSPSQIDLQTDKERYIYGDTIKLTAIISENQNARANNSNKIAFYNGDNLLETKQVVDNKATIAIDTKTIGVGAFNLKAKFSGNDNFESSEAVKSIDIDKAKFNIPVNLKWDDKIAVWDTVYECLEYQIKLYKDNKEIATLNSNTNNYDFTTYFTSTGNYKFQVKALGNQNYNESDWSAEVKIYIYLDLEYNIDKCLELLNDPEATAKDLIEAIVGLSRAITEFELNGSK